MIQNIVFQVIGGLGMFLFGMKFLSDGLQQLAGNRLRRILEVLTQNRFMGIAVGTLVTGIVQSSSTVTVMTVGFVNAGLMNLKQAISVILGANIGTTVTAQIIAFKIDKFALPAIGIGAFLILFARRKDFKQFGYILWGFGLLFFGLDVMKESFMFLKNSPSFQNSFVVFSGNPLLAVLAGAVLTMVIQSSSATIGITIALATTGLIDFQTAFPLVLGENIGTTITAQLASIGTNITARRTATAHTMFNVIGTLYMLLFLYVKVDGVPVFLRFVNAITPGDVFDSATNIDRHIANAHSLFNVFNVVIFIPFVALLAKICEFVIPGKVDIIEGGTKYLDIRFLEIPSAAINQAKKETARMARFAENILNDAMAGVYDAKQINETKVYQQEQVIDDLQREIIEYLISLEDHKLTEEDIKMVNNLMNLVHDLEKIGDHSVNILQLSQAIIENKAGFSDEALKELREMDEALHKILTYSIDAFVKNDITLAQRALQWEGKVDNFKQQLRSNYIQRLTQKTEPTASGIIYSDIVNNLERIGDHANKLAKSVLYGYE